MERTGMEYNIHPKHYGTNNETYITHWIFYVYVTHPYVSVAWNSLTGTLPSTLGALTGLTYLWLGTYLPTQTTYLSRYY